MDRWMLTLAGSLCLTSTLVGAQSTARPRRVISVQPLAVIANVWTVEYERALRSRVTLGGGASYFRMTGWPDAFDAISAEAKLRFYPQARALEGWSLGVSAGVASIGEESTEICEGKFFLGTCRTETRESGVGPSLGVMLDYGWLLGKRDRTYLGIGLGAKHVFVDDGGGAGYNFRSGYPTARFSLGFAF